MRRSMSRRGGRCERRGRTPANAPAIRVVRDAEEVFRAAILAGVLSAERAHRNWAGHYLYMFHDEDGAAWFKHRDTRVYVSMTAPQNASAAWPPGPEAGTGSPRSGRAP